MSFGRFWGSLFFLFLAFASFTTVIAVFENIIGCFMDITGFFFMISAMANIPIVILGSLPVALGFNALSHIEPMGSGTVFLDLYDFFLSYNILPIGALVYVLFCMTKLGWGYENFMKEVNTGKGLRFPTNIKWYFTYIVPAIIIFLFIMGYISMFRG
jgi:NSS family neurotransmitter:Na+ symporter